MTSRKEVAEWLRELRHKTYYREEIVENICDAINIADPVDTFREPEDVYELLADLIDPTCTADIKREDDGIDAQPYYTSSCGNCGALWDTITGAALLPKYCPHCGARVVRDERE